MSFADKVVIVTGASSGIGAATAISFCKEGASVVLVGRNEAKLKNISEQCAKTAGKHIVIKADVANDDDAKHIINKTVEDFGKLDVLVNNAGVGTYGTILGGDILEAYDDLIGINLRAAIHLTTLAAPFLVITKGNIINISSVAALKTNAPVMTAYGLSKAALTHFTKGAAAELAPVGVRVNAISPGPVITDILENSNAGYTWEDTKAHTALKRVSDADEIADLILYLASERARGITGSDFVTDNGYLVNP